MVHPGANPVSGKAALGRIFTALIVIFYLTSGGFYV